MIIVTTLSNYLVDIIAFFFKEKNKKISYHNHPDIWFCLIKNMRVPLCFYDLTGSLWRENSAKKKTDVVPLILKSRIENRNILIMLGHDTGSNHFTLLVIGV